MMTTTTITTNNLVHKTNFNDGFIHCGFMTCSVSPPIIAPRHAFRIHHDVTVQQRKVAVLRCIEYVRMSGHVGGGGSLRWYDREE